MVKLADTLDLGSNAERCAGSSPACSARNERRSCEGTNRERRVPDMPEVRQENEGQGNSGYHAADPVPAVLFLVPGRI